MPRISHAAAAAAAVLPPDVEDPPYLPVCVSVKAHPKLHEECQIPSKLRLASRSVSYSKFSALLE